ncbi:MAG TPA: HNH endonuclease signature motif containing protein [Acidimicrobiales bacterium]|nr:HNH endonuclease signature motif containing protein [Acidimicrobiales bacterium]
MIHSSRREELEGAVRTLQRFVRGAEPGRTTGDEARRVVALLAEAERAASSGIALFTPVVVETGSYAKEGHGSAADWLAAHEGSSSGVARGRLAAAERAAAEPRLAKALHEGELSATQLKILADAAGTSPEAPGTLLDLLSEGSSHQELTDAAARLRASARSRETERARRARVHAARNLRWHQVEGGGVRGEFFCDETAWARVSPCLESEAKRRWKAAGSVSGESFDAFRLDAFLHLLGRRPGRGDNEGAQPLCVVLVDAEALGRGSVRSGELCEIDGIGPVSVDAATELLSEGSVQFIIRSSKDVRTITGTSRHVAQRLTTALLVRDRVCAVPGCGKRHGLEGDHRVVDFAKNGPTEWANLARLCPQHHTMKTHGGWTLSGGPGHWSWDPPPNPPSARFIAKAAQLATVKAKARSARNFPSRT